MTDASRNSRGFSIVAATIFFAAAVALSVFGYLAYRELTPAAVARHRWSKIVSLCVVGIALSFGTHSIGFILMTWAGLLWADDRRRRGRTSHRPIPPRVWTWAAVATAVITLACELLLPLVLGIGSLPLLVAMIAGRIIAPFAFGVAFRLRWGAYGVL